MECFGFFKSKGKECLKCPMVVECWKVSVHKQKDIMTSLIQDFLKRKNQ